MPIRTGSPQDKSDQPWLDLAPYRDCVEWIEVREIAPATDPAVTSTAAVPLPRRVRWKLDPTSAGWDFTMRVRIRADTPEGSDAARGEGED
jgi:hypothetical protein